MSENRTDCPKYHQVITKRNAKSKVWRFFGFPGDENGKIINVNISICSLCSCSVSSKATSNLWSHLKCHHPLKYREINSRSNIPVLLEQASCSNDDVDGSLKVTPCHSYNSSVSSPPKNLKNAQRSLLDYAPLDDKGTKRCTLAVTKFLATSMQPYNLVEDESFRQMVKTLNPRYCMPGRKYFSNTGIPKLYLEGVEKLKEILSKNNEKCLSITCDCWTSLANQPYLAITAHFIDSNWNLISACLSCCYFDDDHNAQNINNMIKMKLEEWGLSFDWIVACTTDNALNIINGINLLGITRIPCFAHSINIGVNRCIEVPQVKKVISRIKSLQNSVAHSWKMKRDLTEAQKLLKVDTKNLPSACPTRWWSTLKLAERFLENQLPLRAMLQNFPSKKHLLPEGCEISSLESFIKVASILYDVTENLTSENYVTSSCVFPLIRQIKKNTRVSNEDSALLKTLKEKIISSLIRFEEEPLKELLLKATFLDPRFRLHYFDNDLKDQVRNIIINELKQTTNENVAHETRSPPKKKKRGLAALLEEDNSLAGEQTETTDVTAREVEKYLSMPKIELDENPLTWWKNFSQSFPGLSILAKKYFSMQGSSVPSERVFSKGGCIINKKRCTLSPKNAEMQIFLAYNKKILGI